MSTFTGKNFGPYLNVSNETDRGRLKMMLYQAYNAGGLIGFEHNGIIIADTIDMLILADKIECDFGAYNCHSRSQVERFRWLISCSDEEIVDYINNHNRTRFQITEEWMKEIPVNG